MHTSAEQSSCPTAKSLGAYFVCVVFSKLWQLAEQKELLLNLLFLLWLGVSSPPRLLQPQLHSVGSEMSAAPIPEQKLCWGRQPGVFQLQLMPDCSVWDCLGVIFQQKQASLCSLRAPCTAFPFGVPHARQVLCLQMPQCLCGPAPVLPAEPQPSQIPRGRGTWSLRWICCAGCGNEKKQDHS